MRLNPGSAGVSSAPASRIVSPTGAASISLMPAMMNPTSPAPRLSTSVIFGVNTPSLSIEYRRCVETISIRSPLFKRPLTTRTSDTTPTYESNHESMMSACSGA